MTDFLQWEAAVAEAMLGDQFRLRRDLRRMKRDRERGKPCDKQLNKWCERLERSRKLRAVRASSVPHIEYPDELPIVGRRDDIAEAIQKHRVVVVCGETGSGKSTQLPKICLDMGRGVGGLIGHTQPRRIAARSIASRLAEELGTPLGRDVGFKIRFHDGTRPETYVKLMTDGILLAETQNDRFLEQYDTIILDEAHERSLNIDFLLGYIHRLLPKRPDLRLIITSATIDAERFSEHFTFDEGPAPVIEVSGRSYPVEVRYRPLESEEEDDQDVDMHDGVVLAVRELLSTGPGDVLVFFPTEREIRQSAKLLRGWLGKSGQGDQVELLPLYARLSTAEQNRVFAKGKRRRIVLATNVAESSLTVPNIRYVIDTGTARVSRYAPRSKVQRLPIEAVSQASADQRKGRCGRIGPGICIRLYSEDDYLQRDRFTTPEIRRTNLASVILQTKALRLGPIDEFPFLDPPHVESLRDGYRTLFELGAIDDHRELTDLGVQLSRIPADPRIARMILAGDAENCLHEILIIASALEVQDPRERPPDKQEAADTSHAQFAHEESDFMTYLNLWDFVHDLKSGLSRSKFQKACRQNFLSFNRLREWQDVHLQLLRLAQDYGLRQQARQDDYTAIHRALLTGLLSNVALKTDGNDYKGAANRPFFLWPGSALTAKKPQWVVGAELVETGRRYLRTVARVQPHWIESLSEHLAKHSYSQPHWHARGGAVMAWERITLFGLPLVARRRAPYGSVDPETAREIFIREGLVPGDVPKQPAFLKHNLDLVKQLEAEAAKTRRNDLLVDQYTLANFYFERLPQDVYDAHRLNRWLRRLKSGETNPLQMTREALLPANEPAPGEDEFPDVLRLEQVELPLRYQYQPGEERDGVSVTVPREALSQLPPERIGWLVPGLLEQKIVAMIRSLPKSVRRLLVPAPDTARRVVQTLQYGKGSFESSVAEEFSKIAGEPIDPSLIQGDKLPDHLRLLVEVVDGQGKSLATGRNLAELRRELGVTAEASARVEVVDPKWQRDGITEWDVDDLPEKIEVTRGDVRVPAFPALVDNGEDASLRLMASKPEAKRQHRRGLRRLFVIAERRDLKAQVEWIPDLGQITMYASPVCSGQALRRQLIDLLADRSFLPTSSLPRTRGEYDAALRTGRDRIPVAIQDLTRLVKQTFSAYHAARLALEKGKSFKWQYAVDDMRSHLKRLATPEFLINTPWNWLQQYPRYLQGIARRVDKLRSGGATRDREGFEELQPLQERYEAGVEHQQSLGVEDPELEMFRWMLEEFRVSLFAQDLGTTIRVSAKRLEKQWAKVKQ